MIQLDSLPNGEEVEEWHQLNGITPVGDWGAIRLKYRYGGLLIIYTIIPILGLMRVIAKEYRGFTLARSRKTEGGFQGQRFL